MNFKELVKTHQSKIVLTIGFLLTAMLGFGLGKISTVRLNAPEVKVEQAFDSPINNSQNSPTVQSAVTQNANLSGKLDCKAKIKGNINTKGERIYHVLGGAFYARTNPEMCFNTEAEALAAGFRKSSR